MWDAEGPRMGLLIFHSGDACRKLSRWMSTTLNTRSLRSFHLGCSCLRGLKDGTKKKETSPNLIAIYNRKSLQRKGVLIFLKKIKCQQNLERQVISPWLPAASDPLIRCNAEAGICFDCWGNTDEQMWLSWVFRGQTCRHSKDPLMSHWPSSLLTVGLVTCFPFTFSSLSLVDHWESYGLKVTVEGVRDTFVHWNLGDAGRCQRRFGSP